MKVSEMIALLKNVQKKYGDLNVAVSVNSGCCGDSFMPGEEYFDSDDVEVVEPDKELRIHVSNPW